MTVDEADEMRRRTGRDHHPLGSQPTMNERDASDRLRFLKDLDYMEGGPFASDFKQALALGIEALAELQRFREREPLVLELLGAVHGILAAEARGGPYSFKPLEIAALKVSGSEQPAAPPKAAG